MVLYLAASVIGVVLIVFLVIQLTKSKAPATPSGASAPATGTSSGPARGAKPTYIFTQPAAVGTFALNAAATKEFTSAAEKQAAPLASKIKAEGAGQPGNAVVGIYNTKSVTSITATGYQGIVFVGYGGTYNPSAVIKLERAELKSSRVVPAGPHGGQMVCGYSTATGSEASECVWVTKTTYGQVKFLDGTNPVKRSGAATLAREVRSAVEVKGSS